MWFFTLKKAAFHASICFIVWLLADAVATQTQYSGWIAAFMGACYLLAAWLRYLKSRGVDYMAKLRRKKGPEVPYYLRGEKTKKTRIGINGNRHDFDDDMETAAEPEDEGITVKQRHKYTALAYLIVALLLFWWSQAFTGFAV